MLLIILKHDKDNSDDDEYEKENDKNDKEDKKSSWQRGYKDLLRKQSRSHNALVLFTNWLIHYTRGLFGHDSHD